MVALALNATSVMELTLTSSSSPSSSVHILALVLGVIALGLCLACLIFNLLLRNNRIIKMSSPRLNIVIACGGILASVCCGLSGMDYFLPVRPGNGDFICQIIKDIKLLTFTTVLFALDVVVLVTWHFGDPIRFFSVFVIDEIYPSYPATLSISDVTVITSCTSRWSLLWILALFLYKFPILLFGLREAWWTRGQILPNLNDAYCIVVSSIATVSMATIYFVTFSVFRNWPTVIKACAVVSVWLSTTVAICVVFLPKLLLWKRTPTGKVTRVSISSTNSSMAVLQSFEHMEAELTNANAEIDSLREFIKEKEKSVDKLQNLLTNAENNLAQINFETDGDEAPPTDLNRPQFYQSRLSVNKGSSHFCQEGTDNQCQAISCCLHGKVAEVETCLYLPSDKGYAPAHFSESNNSQHPFKKPSHTGFDYSYARHKYLRQYKNPSGIGFPFQPQKSQGHHQEQSLRHQPCFHHYLGYHDNTLHNEENDLPYDKSGAVFEAALPDGAVGDLEMDAHIAKSYDRIKMRRRSSTPSIHSTASLSKLSRLRSDLSDAMTISNSLRSSWAKDLDMDENRVKRKQKGRDRERRTTVIGIRDITDSIMESYDFQRTFDNQSFVSDCITPRSSEASYEMKKGQNGMSNKSRNNLRKIRRRRRQKSEPVTSLSYTKRGSFSEIPDAIDSGSAKRQSHGLRVDFNPRCFIRCCLVHGKDY